MDRDLLAGPRSGVRPATRAVVAMPPDEATTPLAPWTRPPFPWRMIQGARSSVAGLAAGAAQKFSRLSLGGGVLRWVAANARRSSNSCAISAPAFPIAAVI